jgi:hypothetical protein
MLASSLRHNFCVTIFAPQFLRHIFASEFLRHNFCVTIFVSQFLRQNFCSYFRRPDDVGVDASVDKDAVSRSPVAAAIRIRKTGF